MEGEPYLEGDSGVSDGYPGMDGQDMMIEPVPPYPELDHCQLLQDHFPDWQSNPRMNAYLMTYCFG